MEKRHSAWRSTIIWFVFIVALSFFMRPNQPVQTNASAGAMDVIGASGYTISVSYDEVTGAELRETFDFGELIDGTDSKNEKSGLWENEEFGRYRLCVNAKIKPCIVLTVNEEILVINFESAKSTRSLYNALIEQI